MIGIIIGLLIAIVILLVEIRLKLETNKTAIDFIKKNEKKEEGSIIKLETPSDLADKILNDD